MKKKRPQPRGAAPALKAKAQEPKRHLTADELKSLVQTFSDFTSLEYTEIEKGVYGIAIPTPVEPDEERALTDEEDDEDLEADLVGLLTISAPEEEFGPALSLEMGLAQQYALAPLTMLLNQWNGGSALAVAFVDPAELIGTLESMEDPAGQDDDEVMTSLMVPVITRHKVLFPGAVDAHALWATIMFFVAESTELKEFLSAELDSISGLPWDDEDFDDSDPFADDKN